jgi:hypothetical protein
VNSLKPLAQGVIADLRARKLLPVAILLAAALVAVPVLLSRSSEPVAVEAAAPVEPVDTGGLPGPAEALGERSLVTLGFGSSSDLGSFDARDPFKPLHALDAGDSVQGPSVALAPGTGTAGAPAGASGADVGSGAPAGGGPSTTPDTGGDTVGPAPGPAPTPAPERRAPERRFTYAVDVTFDGPEGPPRTFRNLPRLSMLPNEAAPVLIFLGVGANLSDVVFLVDSTLRASSEGEGRCSPSPEDCATVSIEPGEQQIFHDDKDRRYVLRVDQIREVPLATARQAREREAGSARAAIGAPVRRFLPQLLTELLVIGGQQ